MPMSECRDVVNVEQTSVPVEKCKNHCYKKPEKVCENVSVEKCVTQYVTMSYQIPEETCV